MFAERFVLLVGEHWILVETKSPWDLASPFFPLTSATSEKKAGNVDEKLNPWTMIFRKKIAGRYKGTKVIVW